MSLVPAERANRFGGIACTCVYCQKGEAHKHTNKWQTILGSPHIAVCTNCGHKQLAATIGANV